MKTFQETTILVEDLEVTLRRRPVRTLRVVIRPPDGRVLASAPLLMPETAIRAFLSEKLPWIRRHRGAVRARERPSSDLESGDTVSWLGRAYRLSVRERGRGIGARLAGPDTLELFVPPGAGPEGRRAILDGWYRERLKELIPPLGAKWETALGVRAAEWGIKRMKTRWGTCNIRARRVWLNLELATRPPECLEYVIAHELAHLIERNHNARFHAILDRVLPDWRERREDLRRNPPARDG
ncbi:MAG TPA: SprT family zinc-dependent metalloprotease [Spirochaetia bacterium]|nr:SprT family zinc-dependent metalloprotease [Spirochaetales bacterium]HRY79532.1 SprT family zinc-dependent metalloprotease [Spirochaetia bacterium]